MILRTISRTGSLSFARLQRSRATWKRQMGGGGAFMETNKYGHYLGEVFGTVAWLWIFFRFEQDGAVLLGYEHPWEHGHHDESGSSNESAKPMTAAQATSSWESFSQRSVVPGDDDDDDDEGEDDDE